jgi:hypothetical protein
MISENMQGEKAYELGNALVSPVPTSVPATQMGLLMVRNNDQIEEAARIAHEATEIKLKQPQIDPLASYVLSCWEEAKNNKENNIEKVLIDSWRRRKGVYSPDKHQAITSSGQTPIFMKITEVKCNAFEAWFNDIMTSSIDRLWSLKPTPIPDLPPDISQAVVQRVMQIVMQKIAGGGEPISIEEVYATSQKMRDDILREYREESELRCERMAEVIDDILKEGNWEIVMSEALEHLATFGTAIIKGPIVRKMPRLRWAGASAVVMPEYVMQFEAVHPLNFYPSPLSASINDGYMIEFLEVSRSQISELRKHPGYSKTEIDNLLMDNYSGGIRKFRDLDISRLNLNDNSDAYIGQHTDLMQGIEYHGLINGKLLKDWGVTGIDDEGVDYEVECIMFGNHVIRAVVNDNPIGRKNYSKCNFKPRSGSFWGQSIPELMSDVQDICNGAARALVSNMGIASGPMVVIDDINRIPEGVDLTSLHPWMILQFNGDRSTNKKPVEFYSPDSHANELVSIYERFMRESDDRTGIPAYSYGNDRVAGAGKTASGLSMLINSAARGVKKAITDWDVGIIKPCIERLYHHLMLFHPDTTIKGDAQVVAQGAMGIFAREQQEANLRTLMAETGNEIDMSIIGQIGRAELLRRRLRFSDRSLEKVVPTNEEIIERAEMQAKAQATMAAEQQQTEMEQANADRQARLEVAKGQGE